MKITEGQDRLEAEERLEKLAEERADHEREGHANSDDQQLPRRGSAELKAIIEALIFASPDPLTLKAIYKLLDSEPKEDVQAAIAELKQDYERPGGLQLVEVAGIKTQ